MLAGSILHGPGGRRSAGLALTVALLVVACSSTWTGGIQAVLARRAEGPLRVVDVPPGSVADRAGLREGDEIVTIDDVSVSGRRTTDAVARLRGEVGSRVVLGVQRGDERVTVRIERGPFGERFGRDRRPREPASSRRAATDEDDDDDDHDRDHDDDDDEPGSATRTPPASRDPVREDDR